MGEDSGCWVRTEGAGLNPGMELPDIKAEGRVFEMNDLRELSNHRKKSQCCGLPSSWGSRQVTHSLSRYACVDKCQP